MSCTGPIRGRETPAQWKHRVYQHRRPADDFERSLLRVWDRCTPEQQAGILERAGLTP